MTDFSFLPRLAISERDLWEELKSAFDTLRDVMRRDNFFGDMTSKNDPNDGICPIRKRNYEDMARCVQDVFRHMQSARVLSALDVWEVSGSGHIANPTAAGAPKENLAMTCDQASAFAKLALKGLQKEYPNKPAEVLSGDQVYLER